MRQKKLFWFDLQTFQHLKSSEGSLSPPCPRSVQVSSQLLNITTLFFFFLNQSEEASQLLRTDDAELLLSDSESVSSPQLLLGLTAPDSDLHLISCSARGIAASLLSHGVGPLADGGLLIKAGMICRRGDKGFQIKSRWNAHLWVYNVQCVCACVCVDREPPFLSDGTSSSFPWTESLESVQ